MTSSIEKMACDIHSQLVKHFVNRIENTPAETEPFTHVTISNFFPADIYAEMLKNFPDEKSYEIFSYAKHKNTDGSSNRYRFKLTNEWLEKMPARAAALWMGVRNALGDGKIKNAIYSSLREGLGYRYQIPASQAANLDGYALPELFREYSGYSIKPHPDTRRKVVTMQIALPRDDSQIALGTEFYRRSLNPLHLLREPRGFVIDRQMKFLPNSAYAFTVLNTMRKKSWHGRSTISGPTGERNSILNIWYANQADANADIPQAQPAQEQFSRAA